MFHVLPGCHTDLLICCIMTPADELNPLTYFSLIINITILYLYRNFYLKGGGSEFFPVFFTTKFCLR